MWRCALWRLALRCKHAVHAAAAKLACHTVALFQQLMRCSQASGTGSDDDLQDMGLSEGLAIWHSELQPGSAPQKLTTVHCLWAIVVADDAIDKRSPIVLQPL